MAVTNGWGQGVINNTNGYGKLATNNIGAGSIYENSYTGDTALIGTSAAFSYSASSFTQADSNPTPTITGTTGGTFSGTSGLVFVSTSTGEINLSASTIAAHVVTYTVDGVSATFNLSVTAAPYASTSSFSFDGVNDYFEITTDSTIDNVFTNPFTVSFWIKIPTSASGQDYLISKANSSIDNALGLYHSGGVLIWTGGGPGFSYTNGSYRDNTWHHIACVAESASSAIIYVDGFDDTKETSKNRIDLSSITASIILGSIFSKDNFFYLGNMDELSIWDTALSSDAVTEIYNSGTPNSLTSLTNASSSNLKAWYKMGE